MEENQQPIPKNVIVVDLTLDDDDDDDDDGPRKKRASTTAQRKHTAKKACKSTTHSNRTRRLDGAVNDEDDGDDDEIEVLEGDAIPGNFTVAAAAAANSAARSNTERDEVELEVVGTKNQTLLPHVSLSFWRVLLAQNLAIKLTYLLYFSNYF